jgi:hypothetical protein
MAVSEVIVLHNYPFTSLSRCQSSQPTQSSVSFQARVHPFQAALSPPLFGFGVTNEDRVCVVKFTGPLIVHLSANSVPASGDFSAGSFGAGPGTLTHGLSRLPRKRTAVGDMTESTEACPPGPSHPEEAPETCREPCGGIMEGSVYCVWAGCW